VACTIEVTAKTNPFPFFGIRHNARYRKKTAKLQKCRCENWYCSFKEYCHDFVTVVDLIFEYGCHEKFWILSSPVAVNIRNDSSE
jgi:hypothetical protein